MVVFQTDILEPFEKIVDIKVHTTLFKTYFLTFHP